MSLYENGEWTSIAAEAKERKRQKLSGHRGKRCGKKTKKDLRSEKRVREIEKERERERDRKRQEEEQDRGDAVRKRTRRTGP